MNEVVVLVWIGRGVVIAVQVPPHVFPGDSCGNKRRHVSPGHASRMCAMATAGCGSTDRPPNQSR